MSVSSYPFKPARDAPAHLHLGLQEMLTGLAYRTDEPADTDLVSYWRSPLDTDANSAPEAALAHARFVRLLASAYGRPTGLVTHLRPTIDALLRVVDAVAPAAAGQVRFQGHVLPLADFVVTWAVEGAVHQLDLTLELELPGPPPEGLALVGLTLDGLLGPASRPETWSEETYALKGSGRLPLTDAERDLLGTGAGLFPLLG